MRRDRKAAQKKNARAAAQKDSRRKSALASPEAQIRRARECPLGPAFISKGWRNTEMPPALVTVVITRRLPNDLLVPQIILVDRTCFGVKNAVVVNPMSASQLADTVDRIFEGHRDGGEPVEATTAQSIVFAAVDYAQKLGFAPNRDFDALLAGPRPEPLEATPLGNLPRPFFAVGPYDDEARVTAILAKAVGADGFDVGHITDDLYDDGEPADEVYEDELGEEEAP